MTAKVIVFCSTFETGSIATIISSYHKKVVTINRDYLKCVIDTLLFRYSPGIEICTQDEIDSSKNKVIFLSFFFIFVQNKALKLLHTYYVENQHHYNYGSASYTNKLISLTAH